MLFALVFVLVGLITCDIARTLLGMLIKCGECSAMFEAVGRRGPTPRFCSARCRKRASRSRGKLLERFMSLAEGRWVRASGKRPVTIEGVPASSTNSATWSSHCDVVTSKAGDGLGVMLGGGLACLDLDDCFEGGRISPWAREAIDSLGAPVLLCERSVSGRGLHVFHECPEGPGRRVGGVEHYSRARFIRVTFDEVAL